MNTSNLKVAEMLKTSGRFELLPDMPGYGRYTLTVDGKTASAIVDIDTLTRGAGLDSADDVKEYEDITNPVFDEACTSIAFQLGWMA